MIEYQNLAAAGGVAIVVGYLITRLSLKHEAWLMILVLLFIIGRLAYKGDFESVSLTLLVLTITSVDFVRSKKNEP